MLGGRALSGRDVSMPRPRLLRRNFFARSVHVVAPDLIGATLLFKGAGAVILEVEAYHHTDPAAHSFGGRTERNSVMFGPPGYTYVYRSYGVHWCLHLLFYPQARASAEPIRPLAPPPRGEALLVDVAADRLERRPVWLEPVGPEVLAELAPRFLDVIDQPRQRDAQRIGVVKAVEREVARLHERPVDVARRPRMRTMHVLAQHHRVHDRQNARAAVIIALDVFIIREQARDRRGAFEKELRDVERQQRVELTRRELPLQRLPPGEEIEPDVAREIERDQRRPNQAVEPAHEPVHVPRLDAVIVLQNAAPEDEAGRA